VAQYAKRIVVVRDGHIVRDTPVTNRRRAEDDLRALNESADDADEKDLVEAA
jgi:hypothetical protein